jgi:hypothetical protein
MAKARGVRVYVGTRKGAYAIEGDPTRRRWKVRGPYHKGSDVFQVMPDPRHPGTVYAAVNSVFFGPMLQRSTDEGKHWKEIAPPMMPVSKQRPPPNFEEDPRDAVRPIKNIWQILPGPADQPDRLFVGIDPAKLFRSDDAGKSWVSIDGLNEHETRPKWNPGAGGMCLHTILQDPTRPNRMYVGISAAGMFRTDDGGDHWTPMNKGVRVSFMPVKDPPVGQCVHKVVLDAAHPETAYRQDHDGIYVSHDSMEMWKRIGRPLGGDFGFVVTSPASMPGRAFFMPLDGYPRTAPGGSLQVQEWNDGARSWRPTIRKGQFPGDIGVHRDGLASDSRDPAGLYLGTTTGDVVVSNNGGKTWAQVPYRFPSIHSVTVADAA